MSKPSPSLRGPQDEGRPPQQGLLGLHQGVHFFLGHHPPPGANFSGPHVLSQIRAFARVASLWDLCCLSLVWLTLTHPSSIGFDTIPSKTHPL